MKHKKICLSIVAALCALSAAVFICKHKQG